MPRRFIATLLALALLAAPAQASQATLVTPAAPLPMTSLASFLNSALLSLGSHNSGTSAPANGTGAAAFAGEAWINTTGNPWIFQYTVDGTHWTPFLYLNYSTFSQSYPGTSTNDSAPAGAIGETVLCKNDLQTSTVTISNASPGVISWSAHGLSIGAAVHFTNSGGALNTGLTVGTNYYVSTQGFGVNSFSVSTSVDNALAGTSVNTSSAGSGTQTAVGEVILATGTPVNVCGISLTAGDWDVEMRGAFVPATTTVLFHPTFASINTVSGTADTTHLDKVTSVPLPQAGSTGGGGYNALIQPVRYSLSGTTTIYGILSASFTTSTLTAAGYLRARRVR